MARSLQLMSADGWAGKFAEQAIAHEPSFLEFAMSVSYRLMAFIAAVAITALSFVGPAYAAPSVDAHQAAMFSTAR